MTNPDWQRLAEENQALVWHILKTRHITPPHGTELEDLAQEGMAGLVIAAKQFDPSRGFQFSTFAGKVILTRIYHALRSLNRFANRSVYADDLLANHYDGFNSDDSAPPTFASNTRAFADPDFSDDRIAWMHITAVIRDLPEADRLMITLRLQGKSQAVIAGEVGLSQAQVSRRLTRLKAKLTG